MISARTKIMPLIMERYKLYPKSKSSRCLISLYILLPLIDSLNGLLNNGGNEGVLSLGVIYRVLLGIVCISIIIKSRPNLRSISLLIVTVIVVFLPHATQLSDKSFLMIAVKTVFPIICIEAIARIGDPRKRALMLIDMMNVWSVVFPLTIIIPELFGVGFQTYGGSELVGYKGFYYAQNDLCFVLVILFFISCKRAFEEIKIENTVPAILNGICILQLGLKGGYLLTGASIIYCICTSNISRDKKRLIAIACVIIVMLSVILLSNIIVEIVDRWTYFIHESNSFFSFLSSGRVDRIPVAIKYLNEVNNGISWIFFGEGPVYGNGIQPQGLVEIDPIDIFFQFGLIGVSLIAYYYGRIVLRTYKMSSRYILIMLLICILMALTAGHVFNSALSGMVVSVVFSLAIATQQEQFPTAKHLKC